MARTKKNRTLSPMQPVVNVITFTQQLSVKLT